MLVRESVHMGACVRVCVHVCVCVGGGAIAQLVKECIWRMKTSVTLQDCRFKSQ